MELNCAPHKERLGQRVRATREISGTSMCEECYKGKPLKEVTQDVTKEVSTAAAQLGKRGGTETAKRGPEYFREIQAKRKTKGANRLSWDRETKILLKAAAILKKENFLNNAEMCKAAYEVLISVPCEKLEEKGFL